MKNKLIQRVNRHKRLRSKIIGTEKMPRLSVFRSSMHIYAQIIDDSNSKTLVSATDIKVKNQKNRIDSAQEVGLKIAKEATSKKINKVVFDRGGYKYHGRVKALAEAARKGGLTF